MTNEVESEKAFEPTRLPWLATAVLALVGAAIAVWAATPSGEATRDVRWRPFQATDVLQMIALGDAQVSANVQAAGPRIVVKAPMQLVFRDVDDARAVEVDTPKGRVALKLADDRVGLTVSNDGLDLRAGKERAEWAADGERDWRASLVRLDVNDGKARALLDGEVVAEVPVGDLPAGRSWVHAFGSSSFNSVAVERASGERRSAQPGAAVSSVRRKQIWAGLAVAFGIFGFVILARRAGSEKLGTSLGPDVVPAANIYGGLVALVLMAGVWTSLEQNNRERVEPPKNVDSVAVAPWGLDQPRSIERGTPFNVPRIDGDFMFEATLTLEPDSAVDILLRGAPIERDRGLVLSLSTDAAMSCGLHANLGTSWTEADVEGEPLFLTPNVPHTVQVRANAHRVRASIDGGLLATLDDTALRAGRTAFLALRGRAKVVEASIKPIATPGPLNDWLWDQRTKALGWILAGVALMALVGWRDLGAVSWLGPLAVVAWPEGEFFMWHGVTLSVACVVMWPEQRRRLTTWLAGAVVVWATVSALTEKPAPFEPAILNALNLEDIHGDAFPPSYVWARHPLARRFNGYVRSQTFRGGKARFDASGATRIIALGSSSTFGYGVGDKETFAALLDQRLGHRGQVLNAGVPGGHAERFVSYVENVLVDLDPDVLIITLGYNDHIQGGRYDERAHFEAMTTDGIGPVGRLRLAYSLWSRTKDWFRFSQAKSDTPDPDDELRFATEPAARFGESIEAMTRAAQEAGIAVVLVQEPIRPGESRPVLNAYHAALADVAERTDALLVATQPAVDEVGPSVYIDIVHPNADGHRILARELVKALVNDDLVAR